VGVRARTVLLLLGTAIVLWAVLQSIGIWVADRVADQIDGQAVAANVNRAVAAIEFDAARLTPVAADWAERDDTRRFLSDGNAQHLTGIFTSADGTTAYAKSVDSARRGESALPAGLIALSSRLGRSGDSPGQATASGVANLPSGPVLVAVQPISASGAGADRPAATLVTGYRLSASRLAALQSRLLFPVSVAGVGLGGETLAADHVTGYGAARSIGGALPVGLAVTQPRAAYAVASSVVLIGGGAFGLFALLVVAILGLTLDAVVLPDSVRALQSQMLLDIACESMDRLSDGLTTEAAETVCRLVLGHSTASSVAITDTEQLLCFAGVGHDHHLTGNPIDLDAEGVREAPTGTAHIVLRGRDELGCTEPRCPLKAAIIVPLRISERTVGTLRFYFTSARKLDKTSLALADGLGRLLSMRLELDRSYRELAYMAAHDPLTGLANRRQFERELERELSEQKRHGGAGALLWFDLDHFKDINDCLGHAVGDELLVAFAQLLGASSRDYCTLARLGGDEFGMLVPRADEVEAQGTASRLLRMLSDASFSVAGHEARVTASIGLVRFPEHGDTSDELMARADLAMYEAKATGGNRIVAYAQGDLWRSQMAQHIEIGSQIVDALREGRFVLYAQPLQSLADNSVSSYELLLRMIGEDGDIVMPASIIPTAERIGVIRDIDRWVACEAIRMLANEKAAGRETYFSINLSGAAFSDPELLDTIREGFRSHDVLPSNLVVEITETTAISDVARAQEFINALKEIGCRFSLDDFGSGASSFYYLKHLPVDFLKIDGGLVKGLISDTPDVHFVRAIIEMCKGLNISTVAEYVEDGKILAAVIAHGIDFAQGFEIGRPGPLGTYLDVPSDAPAGVRTQGLVAPAES
jgi:diguanylate cyclase (GGDEF)-like protein